MSDVACPDCGGKKVALGFFPVYADHVPQSERKPVLVMDCPTCEGIGTVTAEFMERRERGRKLRDRRRAARYGPREFAELIGILPSELSNAEQGRIDPDTIDTKGLLA